MNISPMINNNYYRNTLFTSKYNRKDEYIDLNKEAEAEEIKPEKTAEDKKLQKNLRIMMGAAMIPAIVVSGIYFSDTSKDNKIEEVMNEITEEIIPTHKDTVPQLTTNNDSTPPKVILFNEDGSNTMMDLKKEVLGIFNL